MKLKIRFPGGLLSKPKAQDNYPILPFYPNDPLPCPPENPWKEFRWAILVVIIALVILLTNILSYAQEVKKGGAVPDVTITSVFNYPTPSLRLSELKGKVVILDFWATWCAPCVAMIPKMDSLQRSFNGRVQFISVAYQPETEVRQFMEKLEKQQGHHYDLAEVAGDTTLSKLFPHHSYPHYVWIGADGKVAAITDFGAVNRPNIQALLASGSMNSALKQDADKLPWDYRQPLLIKGNGGDGSNLLYHSFLTSYTPGLTCGKAIVNDSLLGRKITCRNYCLYQLFTLAWSDSGRMFNRQNTRLAVRDTTRVINAKDYGQRFRDWLAEGNGFCYELQVPKELAASSLKMMRQDLDRYFLAYSAKIIRLKKSCLVLNRLKDMPTLQTIGGKPDVLLDHFSWEVSNCTLGILAERLNYTQVFPYPVIDETGISNPVDLKVSLPPAVNGQQDLKKINQSLAAYGLHLSPEERTIEQLVISDRQINLKP